jgi:hypothetical protein
MPAISNMFNSVPEKQNGYDTGRLVIKNTHFQTRMNIINNFINN